MDKRRLIETPFARFANKIHKTGLFDNYLLVTAFTATAYL